LNLRKLNLDETWQVHNNAYICTYIHICIIAWELNLQLQRQRCSRLKHFFQIRRTYFYFQNTLGYLWRCKFLQRWRCKFLQRWRCNGQSYIRLALGIAWKGPFSSCSKFTYLVFVPMFSFFNVDENKDDEKFLQSVLSEGICSLPEASRLEIHRYVHNSYNVYINKFRGRATHVGM
jgi:hypothetical protein